MALSGSWNKNVGAGWRLRLEWSATQNISANTSTITVRLYWVSLGSSYTVNSSVSKTCSIGIGGTWSNKTSAGLAKLSGNQKKLIHSYSRTVSHNADGTLSVSLGGWFDAQVTLSGVYYNRIQVDTKTVTLNRIPRASSISSSASWTAGSNHKVTISRASSSFTHTVRWQVQDTGGTWRTIKTVNGVGTSVNSSFSVAQNRDIFNRLAQTASRPSRVEVETYSGSTKIGSTTRKTGTCKAPSASTTTRSSSFNIGSTVSGTISRQNSNFTHTLQYIFGGTTYTLHTRTSSTNWSYNTSGIASSLYNKIPSAKSISGTLRIYTYYDGVQVRSYNSYSVTARIVGSEPTFSSSQISYIDTNNTTIGVTGNNQYIIQNKSNLRVTITSSATPKNGATIKEYIITCGNRSATSSGIGAINLGTINASSNVSLSVRAVDSRGFSTTVSKTVEILPYNPPAVNTTALRQNGFESNTTLSLRGSISPLRVGTSNKNSVQTARFQYRQLGVGSFTSLTNFSFSQSVPGYTATNRILSLDNLKAWEIRVIVTDRIASTTINLTVPVGQPILFIDSNKKSVGINKFTTNKNAFEVNGRIYATSATLSNGLITDGILNTGSTTTNTLNSNSATITGNIHLTGNITSSSSTGLMVSSGEARLVAENGYVTLRSLNNNVYLQGTEIRAVAPNSTSTYRRFRAGAIHSGNNLELNGANTIYNTAETLYLTGEKGIRLRRNDTGTLFYVSSDSIGNRIYSIDIYNRTYSSTANVCVTSTGTLGRVTSASKYKINIQKDNNDYTDKVLGLDLKSWYDKSAVEAYSRFVTLKNAGIVDDIGNNDIPYMDKHYGLIAEDLIDAGLSRFVVFGEPNENGDREVEGIMYDRLWITLIPIIRKQRDTIDDLERRIILLENK